MKSEILSTDVPGVTGLFQTNCAATEKQPKSKFSSSDYVVGAMEKMMRKAHLNRAVFEKGTMIL